MHNLSMGTITADTTASAPLCPVSDCLVIPGEDALYVLNRRGSFELRAKRIHVLHERMRPYLNSAHTEAELLAAVPAPLTGTLRVYLTKLREVGALAPAGANQPREVDLRGPALLHSATRSPLQQGLVARAVGDPRPLADRSHRLHFATPESVGRLLLRFPGRIAGSITCVVAEPADGRPPSPEELEHCAVYARWLLRSHRDVADAAPRVRVFSLDKGTGALTRMLDARASEVTDPSSLLDRLGAIRRADVDQVPLTVLTAAHRFFRATVSYFGVSYSGVHACAARTFIARSLLWPTARKRFCTFRLGTLGAPIRGYAPVHVAREEAANMSTAPSWSELRLQLLEEFARQNLPAEAIEARTEVDLLCESYSSPAIAALQHTLRLRLASLPARAGKTSHGLFVFSYEHLTGSSFIRERAIFELLLAAAWSKFYAGGASLSLGASSAPVPACDPLDFIGAQQLRRLVHAQIGILRRRGERVRVVVNKLHSSGTDVWVGATIPHSTHRPGAEAR